LKSNKDHKSELRVVVASRNLEALRALRLFTVPHDVAGEAMTTGGLYRLLPGADLVVVDAEDLLESEISHQTLARILQESGIPATPSAAFLESPLSWQERALAATGSVEHLPRRCVAFTSLSGGVGKTTLALDTAVAFARATGLPVLVTEFCHGASALTALTGAEGSLYDAITQGQLSGLGAWQGVSVLPMDFTMVRLIPEAQVRAYLEAQIKSHVLTVFDAHYMHSVLARVEHLVDEWFLVFAGGRPDTVADVPLLQEKLAERKARSTRLVLNQKRLGDGLASGLDPEIALPWTDGADHFDGRLGARLLEAIYPTFATRRKKNAWTRPGPGLARLFAR
jgi:hypothetical protein